MKLNQQLDRLDARFLSMIRSVTIFVATVLVAAVPSAANACLNETLRSENQVIRDVQQAERHLSQGRPERALRAFHDIGLDDQINPFIEARRARLYAVTVVRLDGHVRGRRVVRNLPESERIERLTNALAVLWLEHDTPEHVQWNAEARLALGREVPEAIAALERLAHDDLMVDAYGYRALVLHTTGSVRAAFLARCERLAGTAAPRICRVPVASA